MWLKNKNFNLDNMIFLLVSIIFAVLILFQIIDIFNAVSKYTKIPAQIIEMKSFYGNRGGHTDGVRVKYTVNDNIYKHDVKYCKSNWKKGDIITIYCNPDDVEEIVTIEEKTRKILMYLFAELIFTPPIFIRRKKKPLGNDIRLKKWIRAFKNRRGK